MKKTIILLGVMFCGFISAQSVGINTPTPNSNSILDIVSTNQGLLPPRIALTSTALPSPLSAHVAGMLVYNTATVNDVLPAIYYNNGTEWVIAKGVAENIYNSDGTLTDDRSVTMSGKTLNFGNSEPTERVGIGGVDPFAKLNVNGFIQFASDTDYGVGHVFNDATGEKYGITQTGSFADGGGSTRIYTSGAGTPGNITLGKYTGASSYTSWVLINKEGKVGIGTTSPTSVLSVNGTADKPGGGSWGTFSDRRVKKDITDFKDGLNVIAKLNPVTYRYNERSGYKDLNKEYVGFIAQDVESTAPYMVNIIDDTKKSGLKDKRELDESALTKILVNAIKEQQREIEKLGKDIEELKKKVSSPQ